MTSLGRLSRRGRRDTFGLAPSVRVGTGGGPPPGYSFTNAEAATYIGRYATQPDDAYKGLIDTFVGDLKNGKTSGENIWAGLDDLVLLCAPTQQASLLGMKGKIDWTVNGSPTFVAGAGWKSAATTAYLKTTWTPADVGNNFSQNSACIGSYCRDDVRIDNGTLYGNGSGTALLFMNPWRASADVLQQSVNAATSPSVATPTTAKGLWWGNRVSSGQQQAWRGATKFTTSSLVTNGLAADVRILNNGAQNGAGRQQSFFFIGGGRTDAAAFDLATAINTLLAALGAT